LNGLARPFVAFAEKFFPDPFSFAIILTIVAFLAAMLFGGASAETALLAWGDGLPGLMAFTAQISITLIAAHVVAYTDPVQRSLRFIAKWPKHPWQAYGMVALVSALSSLVAWPLGLVAGGTLAKQTALEAKNRSLTVDYPLLVASAYSGFAVWHMGYSGSAPLFVATPGHALEATIGVISVHQTIFAPWNMLTAFVSVCVITLVCASMGPSRENARTIETGALPDSHQQRDPKPVNFAQKISRFRGLNVAIGIILALYIINWFSKNGFSLTLDIVNWTFVAAGLTLARSPFHYINLALDGGKSLGALIIQYPFYAGIMGLIAGTGLLELMSTWFAENASPQTLALYAFVSGGIVNFFVPSGGGQWAIQGPIFMDSATQLGVDHALIVMAVAYGDQWTNMAQPFFTIPLLAIAGLKVQDIIGYTFVTLIATFFIFAAGLYLAGVIG